MNHHVICLRRFCLLGLVVEMNFNMSGKAFLAEERRDGIEAILIKKFLLIFLMAHRKQFAQKHSKTLHKKETVNKI